MTDINNGKYKLWPNEHTVNFFKKCMFSCVCTPSTHSATYTVRSKTIGTLEQKRLWKINNKDNAFLIFCSNVWENCILLSKYNYFFLMSNTIFLMKIVGVKIIGTPKDYFK